MTLWFVFALMTAAAIFAVLWPLGRGASEAGGGTEAAVYADQLGEFPLSQRTRVADANQPLDNLVAQVEAHLEKNPTDGRGWNVLAPVLARLGRYDEAIRAYRNSITYNGDSAERRSDLGEALMGAAAGVITGEAKAEFERALALNADDVKASDFLGLAAEQDGRNAEAASIWRAMLAKAPTDAPWRPLVEAALARVGGSAP